MPWRIRLQDDEAQRLLADPWPRERAGPEGAAILARGVLPMREEDRGLSCVFLDGDGLCGLHKRQGESALPRSCQAFPFAFVRDEDGAVIAQLSQLCPSIRDDYGEPVAGRLAAKLQQKGETYRMAEAMVTLGGVVLSRPQYARVARRWEAMLAAGGSAAAKLAHLHDWTTTFEGALPDAGQEATDAAVTAAMERADGDEIVALPPRPRASFMARVLFAGLLSSLCHPSRVRLGHRIGQTRPRWIEALGSLRNKLAWLFGRGTVDMLFVPQPFKLQRAHTVERFLAGDPGALVTDFLRLVVQRRQIFCTEPRPLKEVVVDLALATALISRVARCRAAAAQRATVTPEDVREGISVAELLVTSHAALAEQAGLVRGLRRLLVADRARLREVLATEA